MKNKQIRSLAFLLLTFLYCFVLALILEGGLSRQSFSYKISLMIAIPLGVAIYSRSVVQNEQKIYSRMIFGALWSSLLISIIIELLAFTASGEAALGVVIWPAYALVYLLIECLISLIIAAYLRVYNTRPKSQVGLKRSLIFVLLMPYLVVIFDHIQKATTHAVDCGLAVCSNGTDLSIGMLVVFVIIAFGLPLVLVRKQ